MLLILMMIDDGTVRGLFSHSNTVPVMRVVATIAMCFTLGFSASDCCADPSFAGDSGVVVDDVTVDQTTIDDLSSPCDPGICDPRQGVCGQSSTFGSSSSGESALDWLDRVRVGYDRGFVIASESDVDLEASRFPFRMKIGGWGQLRHTATDFDTRVEDQNQFQLKRGRLVFSGSAYNPDISYFVQLDGRSSTGDGIRLLDYYVGYDFGRDQLGLEPGSIALRMGKYKVPFTMSRWLSGRDFEFADRSVSSIFFDVNRSFAVGLYGQTKRFGTPINWDTALFNGLVTGGAETGSSGTLDNNFAYSGRLSAYPTGDWGNANLPDLEWHNGLATRVGCGFASSVIERFGATEFNRIRVVDSGNTLANVLPNTVSSYAASLFAVDASLKYRGWSSTLEYYFRNISDVKGAAVPELFDHGFWFQLGKFVVPERLELVARWSRVQGDSGTLGTGDQSSEEIAGGLAWYIRKNHIKMVFDVTHLDGAPVNSQTLNITPGDRGWLFRSQMQFAF